MDMLTENRSQTERPGLHACALQHTHWQWWGLSHIHALKENGNIKVWFKALVLSMAITTITITMDLLTSVHIDYTALTRAHLVTKNYQYWVNEGSVTTDYLPSRRTYLFAIGIKKNFASISKITSLISMTG